jgi:dihydrofolate reductase
MYITHIKAAFEGDTFFPKVDWTTWKKRNIFSHEADSENPHDFEVVCYEK